MISSMTKTVTEMDRDLLLEALSQMTGRFIRCARDFGYDDKLIDACTFYEIALINRIKTRLELTGKGEI